MSDVSLPNTLTAGAVENVNHVQQNDERLRDVLNMSQDCGAWAALGVSVTAGTVRRGKTITATEESRTSASYGLMATADRVSSVVLPTDGLLIVAYSAEFKSSVSAAGRAAIFLGSNQLKDRAGAVQEASTVGTAYVDLGTIGYGLASGGVLPAEVTTGQAVGSGNSGFAVIRAAAGTYDVSVQTKSASGSVTMKNRKLWVEARGF